MTTLPILNRRFVLADDDADDAEIFCEALSVIGADIQCDVALNGVELFKLLSSRYPDTPDVIFLDINMPLMNGWDCLRQLKISSTLRRIPIIMYSTSSAKKDIDKAYEQGALYFLTKPEDFRVLRDFLQLVALCPSDCLSDQLKAFQAVSRK